MRSSSRGILVGVLALVLSACALGDVPAVSTPVPVTLPPPPTVVYAGDCTETDGLDTWAQASEFFVAQFLTEVNRAANQSQGELRDTVQLMARIRDEVSKVVTPDCAAEVQQLIVETMNSAVDSFQAFANGDADNLGGVVADVLGRIDRVIAGQNELKARLEGQYQLDRQ